ncbi:MAG: class II aldolase/adducin family protein [bacterium]
MSELNKVDVKAKLVTYAQLAYQLGLVWGRSGNMSLRLDRNHFIITAAGSSLRELSDLDIVECSLDPGKEGEACGEIRPSMEFRMHREIYWIREDVSAILHTQPLFSTLVACSSEIELERAILPESIAYIKKIERVPYQHPGSIALAKEVARRSIEADVLLLENHGVLGVGISAEEVVNKIETLEFLARLTITARSSQSRLKVLPEGIVDKFKQRLKI